jgi:WD40 repeat protein
LSATRPRLIIAFVVSFVPCSLTGFAAGQPGKATDRTRVVLDAYGDPLPKGAVARLGTVRLRAAGAAVGLARDGKTIVAVSGGRYVKLWDARTGALREERELPRGSSPFLSPAYLSPDGRLLAALELGAGSALGIWDVESGKRVHRLEMPERGTIHRAAFSPDGKTLATSHRLPAVQVWDTDTGKVQLLKWDKGSTPEYLSFSADGKRLAGSGGRRVVCWDVLPDVKQLWQVKAAAAHLAFTPDGRTLIASPGPFGKTWHAWDAASGAPAAGVKLPDGFHYAQVAVAPDNRTLVLGQPGNVVKADHLIRFWNLQTGKLLHKLSAGGNLGPFFPDGRSILTHNGCLQRWDLATGRPLLPDTEGLGHRAEVGHVAYSRDGRLLASSAGDGTVRVWDVASAKPLRTLEGRGGDPNSAAFTPDARHLVSEGRDGVCCFWDVQTGKELRRLPLYEADGKRRRASLWNLHVAEDGATVRALAYDMEQGSFELSGVVTAWDFATGKVKSHAAAAPTDGYYTAFSPDGRTLASHGALVDTATGKERLKLQGAARPHGHYCYSPDGRLVAGLLTHTEQEGMRFTTKMTGIQVWEAATGRAVRRIPTDWVGRPVFSPDGRHVAAADMECIRLWDLASGEIARRHQAHHPRPGSYGRSFASSMAFAPDGRTLATGHVDGTILIWEMPVRARSARALPQAEAESLWAELAAPDAGKAYSAIWRLADAPEQALPVFEKHLRPVEPASEAETRGLLADLDSPVFRTRQEATKRLLQLGDRAETLLRRALKASSSVEKRRRLEALLKPLEEPPAGEVLRQLRAVVVLERLDTSEASRLLQALAGGLPTARLTREARTASDRLARRAAGPSESGRDQK